MKFRLLENITEVDSQGNELTAQQSEFFKNSKARDSKGKLLVVYHGSKSDDFNKYRYSKDIQTGTDFGKAFYFTTDKKKANSYRYNPELDQRIKEYTAKKDSLINKMLNATTDEEKAEIYREYKAVRVDGKDLMGLLDDEEYSTGGTLKQQYLNLTNPIIVDADGEDYYKVYPDYFKRASEGGNDGIIVKNVIDNPRGVRRPIDVYIAFSENQIKNIDNENPTDSDNINESERT